MKDLIILFTLLFPIANFGQATSSENFQFKAKFDKEIPVEKLEVFYMEKPGNNFIKINYTKNISKNEIIIFGRNHYVIEVGFPTIIFSLKSEKIYEENKEKVDTKKLFYLVSQKGSFDETFDKEINFNLSKPNIKIEYKYIYGKIEYSVQQIEKDGFNSEFQNSIVTSNTIVKINSKK